MLEDHVNSFALGEAKTKCAEVYFVEIVNLSVLELQNSFVTMKYYRY
jgi:hypothetical protein